MNGIDVDRMYVDKKIFVLEYLEDILSRFCVVKMEKFLLILKGYVKFVLVILNKLGQNLDVVVVLVGGKLYVFSFVYILIFVQEDEEFYGFCVRRKL